MRNLAHLATLACLSLAACGGSAPARATDPAPAGDPVHGDWSCVSQALEAGTLLTDEQTPPVTTPAAPVLQLRFLEVYSDVQVAGASIVACNLFDEDCSAPLAQATTDEDGLASLALPDGSAFFEGFLKVTGPNVPDNYVFFPARIPALATPRLDVIVYTAPMLAVTAALAGARLDTASGIVRVDAHDCGDAPAQGVTVDIQAQQPVELTEYFVDGTTTLSTSADGTDATGVVLGLGVPPGPVGVAARLSGASVGGSIGFARAGAVSSLVVRP